jgi:hypothetical protein
VAKKEKNITINGLNKTTGDRPIKEGKMKGVLVIIEVLVFASAGMAGEYLEWID